MSTIETILFRAMNDTAFADAILADASQALSEYDLSAEELENFKGLSYADFETFASATPEERKTFCIGCTWGPPVLNHNQTALKVRMGFKWNHNEAVLHVHN